MFSRNVTSYRNHQISNCSKLLAVSLWTSNEAQLPAAGLHQQPQHPTGTTVGLRAQESSLLPGARLSSYLVIIHVQYEVVWIYLHVCKFPYFCSLAGCWKITPCHCMYEGCWILLLARRPGISLADCSWWLILSLEPLGRPSSSMRRTVLFPTPAGPKITRATGDVLPTALCRPERCWALAQSLVLATCPQKCRKNKFIPPAAWTKFHLAKLQQLENNQLG